MVTTSPDDLWSPDSGDDYALTTDLATSMGTVQDALDSWKNYMIGTDAERLALTAPLLKAGLQWYATDTNVLWVYDGSDWQDGDTGDVAITLNGGWSNTSGVAAATYRVKNGMVSVNGRLDAGGGATTTAFTLPLGARPALERVETVASGANTIQTLIIATDGQVVFFNLSLPASDYRLASIPPWPAA